MVKQFFDAGVIFLIVKCPLHRKIVSPWHSCFIKSKRFGERSKHLWRC